MVYKDKIVKLRDYDVTNLLKKYVCVSYECIVENPKNYKKDFSLPGTVSTFSVTTFSAKR